VNTVGLAFQNSDSGVAIQCPRSGYAFVSFLTGATLRWAGPGLLYVSLPQSLVSRLSRHLIRWQYTIGLRIYSLVRLCLCRRQKSL